MSPTPRHSPCQHKHPCISHSHIHMHNTNKHPLHTFANTRQHAHAPHLISGRGRDNIQHQLGPIRGNTQANSKGGGVSGAGGAGGGNGGGAGVGGSGGVAAWSDVQKTGATLGNLTPADRHGSVQVCCLLCVHAFSDRNRTHSHHHQLNHTCTNNTHAYTDSSTSLFTYQSVPFFRCYPPCPHFRCFCCFGVSLGLGLGVLCVIHIVIHSLVSCSQSSTLTNVVSQPLVRFSVVCLIVCVLYNLYLSCVLLHLGVYPFRLHASQHASQKNKTTNQPPANPRRDATRPARPLYFWPFPSSCFRLICSTCAQGIEVFDRVVLLALAQSVHILHDCSMS